LKARWETGGPFSLYGLICRTLSRFVFGYTGTMDSFLEAAKKKLA
jgi:hypothetical protein